MSIQHAVLSILSDGPTYGYQIRTRFLEAVGPSWGELHIGNVYHTLRSAKTDGFVEIIDRVEQSERPDRTIYAITPEGAAELDDWLSRPTVQGGYRDDFILKVMAASARGAEAVHEVCEVQRAQYFSELQALRILRRRTDLNRLSMLTAEAAILQLEARLAIVNAAEAGADESLLPAASSAGAAAQDFQQGERPASQAG